MKCQKLRRDMILYLYDELEDKEKERLEAHLKECPACSRELDEWRSIFSLVNKAEAERIPRADWDKCWQGIRGGLEQKEIKAGKGFPISRWALAAASALIVFALGIFFGRIWMQEPDAQFAAAASTPAYAMQLRDYFGSVKPVLLDYANQTEAQTQRGSVVVDKALLKTLLLQNFVLKQMVAERDPQAAQMLEDLEMVLREIINMPEDDAENENMIRNLIKQRDILFKMDVLQEI